MFEWAPPPTPGPRVWTLGPRLAALFGEVTYMAEWVSEVAGGLVGPSLSVVSPGPLLPDLLGSGEPLPHSPPRWVESREWSHFSTYHTVSPEPGRTFSPCLSHFWYLLGHRAMRANNTFSGVILHFTYHMNLWQWENAVLTNVEGLPVTCFCNFLPPPHWILHWAIVSSVACLSKVLIWKNKLHPIIFYYLLVANYLSSGGW